VNNNLEIELSLENFILFMNFVDVMGKKCNFPTDKVNFTKYSFY